MFKIYPDDLSLMSAYGLVNSLAVILLGAAVGSWIDSTSRLRQEEEETRSFYFSYKVNFIILNDVVGMCL